MKYLSHFFLILFSLITFCSGVQAQTKRALIIGINIYKPAHLKSDQIKNPQRNWTNLDGAVNDAKSIKAVLKSKYAFKEENIVTLFNEQASRNNILSSIQKHLIIPTKKGDLVTFYYAGHGSQVKNSQSSELDKLDETLVPADAILGARDIRDKELKSLFNQMIDRGAKVTAIFDSCHSGSIGRGVPRLKKTRRLRTTNDDIADSSLNSLVSPESRKDGAIILSATQDRDVAYEAVEEIEEGNKTVELPHGAFTLALLNTLKATSPDESVERVFQRMLAQMEEQTPVLAGPPQRLKFPLFNSQISKVDGKAHVAILDIDSEQNELLLQGGYAIGLRKGCILSNSSQDVEVKISSIEDMVQSNAKLIKGSISSLKVGELLSVKTWMYSPQKALKVWIPPPISRIEREELRQAISRLNPEQIALEPLDSELLIRNQKGWQLIDRQKNVKAIELGSLKQYVDRQAKVFVSIPLSKAKHQSLTAQLKTKNSAIRMTSKFENSHYYLLGRLFKKSSEFAWIKASSNSLTPLPSQTRWVEESQTVQLTNLIQRVSKVKAWLSLNIPSSSQSFPYKLALKNAKTQAIVQRSFQELKANDIYGLVLVADKEKLKKITEIEQRYVYIFVLDSNGNSTLLFPNIARGNAGNFLPLKGQLANEIKVSKSRLFRVSPPLGIDTYILLTTVEPIPEPHIGALSYQGVKSTRSYQSNSKMPLVSLLFDIGSATRSTQTMTYTNWSLQRLPLVSVK